MNEFVTWVREHLWAAWGVLALGLAAAELFTLDLTLLMLASGAAMGGVTALIFPGLVWLQVLVAIVTAFCTLFLLRPTLLAKVRNAPGYRSSLDKLVGSAGFATAAITGSAGEVKVDGQVWEARSYDPSVPISAGEAIEVFGLDGITLIVYPTSKPLSR
ncbi:nodulation efficiency protein D [Tessaracoccus aquimaris]|uniref:Nodulation efficiency protein D n=1 Tax=Tessaracoccus aquimaris TaxID=1332264 RepID=A0A1Q2CKV5_9ACTN|nr:NfeD family protein [Tessaracoccus aquimaris]AQP46743.1 nodulation efficiency protein D [Tessaracoccus aquimaris]